jgi:hypothetical protein
MKITRTELARIVKEETEAYLSEMQGEEGGADPDAGEGVEHPLDKLTKDVQTLVDQGIELMSMEDPLIEKGYKAKLNSSMGFYFVEIRGLGTTDPRTYMIISKEKVRPDAETKFAGKYAIGAMD